MDSGAIYELEWEKGREGEVLFSGDENNGQERKITVGLVLTSLKEQFSDLVPPHRP